MKTSVELALLALFIAGCATVANLTPEGAKVQLMKSDPPQGCTEISGVDSLAKYGDENAAKTLLRNKAASKGANYVRLETYTNDNGWVKYSGTAFKCP